VGNENYLFIPDVLWDHEIAELEKIKEVQVIKLSTRFTALGNNMVIRKDRCLINPQMETHVKTTLKKLGFKVSALEIAENPTVGACATTNTKGCLIHRDATNTKHIASLFSLPTNIGTVNLGNPYVRTGLLANSHGYIVGNETTGPETQRIDETLGLI